MYYVILRGIQCSLIYSVLIQIYHTDVVCLRLRIFNLTGSNHTHLCMHLSPNAIYHRKHTPILKAYSLQYARVHILIALYRCAVIRVDSHNIARMMFTHRRNTDRTKFIVRIKCQQSHTYCQPDAPTLVSSLRQRGSQISGEVRCCRIRTCFLHYIVACLLPTISSSSALH